MSEQEFKAAKFEIVERYNGLKQRIGVVELKLKAHGATLVAVGEDLKRFGTVDEHQVRGGLPFDEIRSLLDEQNRLKAEFESARKDMATTGIELF